MNTYNNLSQNEQEYTCNISQLNGVQKFNNVPICSQGLGHGKGIMFSYKKGDIVFVTFYGNSLSPIILGSVFNTFEEPKDTIIDIEEGELYIGNIANSGYLHFNKAGELIYNGMKLPISDGVAGQVLKTDGAGNLYWADDNA